VIRRPGGVLARPEEAEAGPVDDGDDEYDDKEQAQSEFTKHWGPSMLADRVAFVPDRGEESSPRSIYVDGNITS